MLSKVLPCPESYEKLIEAFSTSFNKPAEKVKSKTVVYKDAEGDFVTVANEEDFKILCDFIKKDPTKTVKICLIKKQGKWGCMKRECKKVDKNVHLRVMCDGCKAKPIVGIRYKCLGCPNFDFCEKCYNEKAKDHNKDHTFFKIETNDQKNVHECVKCDICGSNPIIGIRYKCAVCKNFDMCEKCEKEKGEEHGHAFFKLTKNDQWREVMKNFFEGMKKFGGMMRGFGRTCGPCGFGRPCGPFGFGRPPCGPCGPWGRPPCGPCGPWGRPPCGPCGPCGKPPCGPCGPCGKPPCGPCGPCGKPPCGPCGPWGRPPCVPCGPCGKPPCGPCGPCGKPPCGPCGPWGRPPCGPCGPCGKPPCGRCGPCGKPPCGPCGPCGRPPFGGMFPHHPPFGRPPFGGMFPHHPPFGRPPCGKPGEKPCMGPCGKGMCEKPCEKPCMGPCGKGMKGFGMFPHMGMGKFGHCGMRPPMETPCDYEEGEEYEVPYEGYEDYDYEANEWDNWGPCEEEMPRRRHHRGRRHHHEKEECPEKKEEKKEDKK